MSSKETNPKDAIGIRKAPFSTVPMNVVAELGVAMLEGASKYGRHNFRGVGVRTSVYFDATMRHLVSFWEGEDLDPDSGLSHITKAIASLVVLRDAQLQSMAEDDRPPRSAPFYPALTAAAGQMLDKHAGKDPKHWTIADAPTQAAAGVTGEWVELASPGSGQPPELRDRDVVEIRQVNGSENFPEGAMVGELLWGQNPAGSRYNIVAYKLLKKAAQ